MRTATFANSSADWRQRASELRARAEAIDDKEGRRTVLNLAKGYDLLAKRAEIQIIEVEK
jgi:hypothetical protein